MREELAFQNSTRCEALRVCQDIRMYTSTYLCRLGLPHRDDFDVAAVERYLNTARAAGCVFVAHILISSMPFRCCTRAAGCARCVLLALTHTHNVCHVTVCHVMEHTFSYSYCVTEMFCLQGQADVTVFWGGCVGAAGSGGGGLGENNGAGGHGPWGHS